MREVPDLGAGTNDGAVVDVARLVHEIIRRGHLNADHLALELQLDAGLLRDRLPYLLDQLECVVRGPVALIDEVVGVQRRDLDPAYRQAFEAALFDEHPGRLRPAGVLERGPDAGLVERRARLAPAKQFALQLL